MEEKLLKWERHWFDLVEEEIRRNTRDGVLAKFDEEEHCALVGKGKNAKGKRAQGEAESSENHGKKKDLSQIKWFHCHEYGQYAIECPHKKSNKEPTTTTGDAFTSQFELDFTLNA